jgi:hypothetical protein
MPPLKLPIKIWLVAELQSAILMTHHQMEKNKDTFIDKSQISLHFHFNIYIFTSEIYSGTLEESPNKHK